MRGQEHMSPGELEGGNPCCCRTFLAMGPGVSVWEGPDPRALSEHNQWRRPRAPLALTFRKATSELERTSPQQYSHHLRSYFTCSVCLSSLLGDSPEPPSGSQSDVLSRLSAPWGPWPQSFSLTPTVCPIRWTVSGMIHIGFRFPRPCLAAEHEEQCDLNLALTGHLGDTQVTWLPRPRRRVISAFS